MNSTASDRSLTRGSQRALPMNLPAPPNLDRSLSSKQGFIVKPARGAARQAKREQLLATFQRPSPRPFSPHTHPGQPSRPRRPPLVRESRNNPRLRCRRHCAPGRRRASAARWVASPTTSRQWEVAEPDFLPRKSFWRLKRSSAPSGAQLPPQTHLFPRVRPSSSRSSPSPVREANRFWVGGPCHARWGREK